jgi:tetratricopeptide (TPR) repeat protein
MRSNPTAVLIAAAAALSGCAGHGNYTSEGSSNAKEKMAVMKSALEWQTAHSAFLSGDLDKALRTIDRGIALNPNVPKSHVLRGRIMMEKGDLEGAIQSFSRAETLEPENVEAQYYLGIAYERLARPDEALARYKRACEIEPGDAQYAVAACEVMIDLGATDDAKQFLTQRENAFRHNAGIRQTRGHIAMLERDFPLAVTMFNEARLLAPEDLNIQEDLVRAQVAAGHFADAEPNLARLLQRDDRKNRRDLKFARARCLIELERLPDAREVLGQLADTDDGSGDIQAWVELGNVALKLNDQVRLRQAWTRVTIAAPGRPEGWIHKGIFLRRIGRVSDARTALLQAVKLEPADDTFLLLGIIEQEMNRPDLAQASFRSALAANPGNTEAARLLGAVSTATAAGGVRE